MSKWSAVIGFVAGAGVGTFLTWRLLNAKYEARFEKELASVRKAYARKEEPPVEDAQNDEPPKEEQIQSYVKVLKETKYANDLAKEQSDYPYAIPIEDLGENYDYGEVDLYYFADGVLTDSNYEPMDRDDIRDTVGEEWKNAIGNYGDSEIVCLCNDARQCYYKIFIDERNYTDVYKIPGYRE